MKNMLQYSYKFRTPAYRPGNITDATDLIILNVRDPRKPRYRWTWESNSELSLIVK